VDVLFHAVDLISPMVAVRHLKVIAPARMRVCRVGIFMNPNISSGASTSAKLNFLISTFFIL
jgi:hypothetical protein